LNGVSFFAFARSAVEGREWAKFAFSRNVSEALSVLRRWGADADFSAEELALLDLDSISAAAALPDLEAATLLRSSIATARAQVGAESCVTLPILLRSAAELTAFQSVPGHPNFITRNRVVAAGADIASGDDPVGSIALLRYADPGYDWLFSRGISGMITAYGGPNSHMAVRALESGIPAAIGCGELLFSNLCRFRLIELDAGARHIRGLA
jgi:phosphohistidine swiveling domain-containing protein